MTHAVLYASNMPCEVGIAAFMASVSEAFIPIPFSVSEAKDSKLVIHRINKIFSNRGLERPDSIFFSGTYWQESILAIAQVLPVTRMHVYCPGKIPDGPHKNTIEYISASELLPTTFIRAYVESKVNPPKNLMNGFFKKHEPVIKMIEDRLLNKDILDNQVFYTGLYNYGPETATNFDRFTAIFIGRVELNDIMEKGKVILQSQIGLAAERVKNNSIMVTLSDGTPAVVTEAQDLINLTQMKLHEAYPNVDVTLTMRIGFSRDAALLKGNNELRYSIRTYNGKNAQEIVERARKDGFKGDGNEKAAGGSFPCHIPIPL